MVLLLKAAKVRQRDWESYWPQAETITGLLGSHTLTLVQAGAFISRDVRNWNEYPKLFKENRQHLLATSWNQAQSKYGNVYATFEVSAHTLESDARTEAKDALCLLGILAMFHHSGLPTFVFEDASKGLNYTEECGYSSQAERISAALPNLLPELLSDWRNSPLRLQSGLYCLEALSFIKQANMDDQDGVRLVSMHPLAHSWAKDRLDQRKKEQAWMMTGSIIALSTKSDPQHPIFSDYTMWQLHTRQLQSHISSFLDNRGACRPRCLLAIEHVQMHYAISTLLAEFGLFREEESFLSEFIQSVNVEPSRPENIDLLSLYQEIANAWSRLEKHSASIDLWKRIILFQESISSHQKDILYSKHGLSMAYSISGENTKAITQLESIVSIEKELYPADHEHCLASEHELGRAYLDDGQAERAIELLEHVVQIRQKTLPESFQDRLASEKVLGTAYYRSDRLGEALQLLEHVARIRRATLHSAHRRRLKTLRHLPDLYIKFEQPEKAKEVVVEFDNALKSVSVDDARWREHGKWLAGWKQRFGIEDISHALSEYDPDPGSDAPLDSTTVEDGSGDESDAGLGSHDAEYESEVDAKPPRWKRFAKRILKRGKRKE